MSILQKKCDETFEHIFQCPEELICPKELHDTQLVNVADGTYWTKSLHKIGTYLRLLAALDYKPQQMGFIKNISRHRL